MHPQISPDDGRHRTINQCFARVWPQLMQSPAIEAANRSHPQGYSSEG
jgi:hypothetical protein